MRRAPGYGTWGPFGATFAQGGEIQAIMAVFAARPSGRAAIDAAFAQAASQTTPPPLYAWRDSYCQRTATMIPAMSSAALLLSMSVPLSQADRRSLEGEFCAATRYAMLPRAFAILGSNAEIRTAYDAKYADQNRRIVQALASIYQRVGQAPTELDWAFWIARPSSRPT
jgi:hypothetical protein